MKLLIVALAVLCQSAFSLESRMDLGWGAADTAPTAPSEFKNLKTGQSNNYFFSYHFAENWAVELGYDRMDFDTLDALSKAYILSAKHFWRTTDVFKPFAHVGLAMVESTYAYDKKSSAGLQAGLGIEAGLFKYASIGGGIKTIWVDKMYEGNSTLNEMKGALTVMPHIYLAIHTAAGQEAKSKPVVEEVKSTVAPVVALAKSPTDSDGDGIIDAKDKCPNTKGGSVVNAYGCAVDEVAMVTIDVQFAAGKNTVEEQYMAEIEKLAAFMKEFPQTTAEVQGHSDNTGNEKANVVLSQKRANAVRSVLISKYGVAAGRLTAKGYGPSQPIADNKTAEGKKQNRRVVAKINEMKK